MSHVNIAASNSISFEDKLIEQACRAVCILASAHFDVARAIVDVSTVATDPFEDTFAGVVVQRLIGGFAIAGDDGDDANIVSTSELLANLFIPILITEVGVGGIGLDDVLGAVIGPAGEARLAARSAEAETGRGAAEESGAG